MMRFIFLTFGFLAFGFYELSGGADFDPVSARETLVAARDSKEKSQGDTVVADATLNQATPSDTENVVARSSLNLVSFDAVTIEPADPSGAVEPTPATFSSTTDAPSEQTDRKIIQPTVELIGVASLNAPSESIPFAGLSASASSEQVSLDKDVRTVTGSLVNMRAGPGTGFGIVGQLSRDTKVEVITDSGSGWVELRALEGGPTGWMADFLLSNG